MHYITETLINLPRNRVIELFDNPDNLYKWQEGLQSFEHISGTPGEPGAKSRLKYKMGKREFEMIEHLDEKDFPRYFAGRYEMPQMLNTIKNTFEEVGESQTKWIVDSHFELSGFIMKTMAFFMPGSFKKQTRKMCDNFKRFAENES